MKIKNKKFPPRRFVLVFALILALATIFTLAGCSSKEEIETKILSAEIKTKKEIIQVKASLSAEYLSEKSSERVYLLAIPSAYTGELNEFEVIADSKAKSKMTFKFEYSGSTDPKLFSAYVLAELVSGDEENGTYSAISKPKYIDNHYILAQNSEQKADSFKGLSTLDVYEGEHLGASSLIFEVAIDEIMLGEYNKDAINYCYEGISYYFNSEIVSSLDKRISEATEMDMRVYLRTVLKYPKTDKYGDYVKEPIDALYYPNVKAGKNGYLPSLYDEGGDYIKAFYSFLGSRYGGESTQYGTVLDYVIGDSVNKYSENCSSGLSEPERFVAEYHSWAKIADMILKSNCENAKVYISTDNSLRAEISDGVIGIQAFLESFAAVSSSVRDWDFAIALNIGTGNDIGKLLSGETNSATSIGASNLSDVTDIIAKESLQTENGNRSVIIDSLSLENTLSDKNRAAYYIYTYYKAAELDFDAVFYSPEEETHSLNNASGNKGDMYYAFLMCGSDMTDQLKGYTSSIPNTSLPNFNDYTVRKLSYEQNVKIEVSEAIGKNKKDFPIGLESFSISGSSQNADVSMISNGENKVHTLTLSGTAYEGYSVITGFDVSAKKIIESGYVGVTLSAPDKTNVALIISSDSSEACYIGEATVTSIPESYFFNIAPFTANIKESDKLTVSLCVLPEERPANVDNEDEESNISTLYVSELALYGSSGKGGSTIITVIIVVFVVLAICGLLFLLTMRRKKRIYRNDQIEE